MKKNSFSLLILIYDGKCYVKLILDAMTMQLPKLFLVHYFFRAVVNHTALVDGTTNSIVKLKTPSQVT